MTAFPINITLVTANLINNFCKTSKQTFNSLRKKTSPKKTKPIFFAGFTNNFLQAIWGTIHS